MKKIFLITFIFVSSFCLFSEGANLGKSASTVAEEIYGKDSIEKIVRYKIDDISYEYSLVRISETRFLVLKSEKSIDGFFKNCLLSAVELCEDKEEIRSLVLELNNKALKEGDANCTVFTSRVYGKPIYFILTDGKFYASFAFIKEQYGNGKYQVECYIEDKEVVSNLKNMVEKYNLYQDNEILKSLGL